MNVLILTPDRVGSTLLQRLITIYMLRKGFDKPVINLHELSNGLEKYIHPDLGTEVLGKPPSPYYSQSLSEIVDLLESVDHYKTSRLAHYHLVRRDDPGAEQLAFYEYLNDNFYIIRCERENLFEYALSWVIRAHSKRLNVYSINEKVDVFKDIYKNGVTCNKSGFFARLQAYKDYIEWTNKHFDVQSCFKYEDVIDNLEEYILGLDFMQGSKDNKWEDMFGIDFKSWNKCHKGFSDLALLPSDGDKEFKPVLVTPQDWKNMKGESWPEYNEADDVNSLPVDDKIKNEIDTLTDAQSNTFNVSKEKFEFLKNNIALYRDTFHQIDEIVKSGLLVTNIPVKLQSFEEKKTLIKNYDECVKWYNDWVNENNFGTPFNEEEHIEQINKETSFFNDFSNQLTHKK